MTPELFTHLIRDEDGHFFKNYLRMTPELFTHLL